MKAFWQHFYNITLVTRDFSGKSRLYKLSGALLAISRLLQIMSFFLPLKILIMLSSDSPPSYFNYLPLSISYDVAIVILVLMVPATYCGYIVSGILHRYCLDKDLAMWEKGQLSLRFFDVNNKGKLLKLHGHVAKSLAEIILIALALALMLYIDAPMFGFVVFLVFVNLNLFVLRVFGKSDSDRIGLFKLHRRQYIEYISSANFIFVFIALALQTKYYEIGVFEALFMILLSRMLFQAMQRFSVENIYIMSHLPMRK